MIGKPEWFTRRKYGGWGLFPKKWQGWLYVLGIIAAIMLINTLPFDNSIKNIMLIILAIIFAIDFLDIFIHLRKDEMEEKIEALAERNAAWAMVLVAALAVAYQVASSTATGEVKVDPFLFIIVIAGVLAKAITNFYLERKGL